MASLLTGPRNFPDTFTGGGGQQMLPLLIVGSLGAAGLLLYGVHKFTKRR